MTRRRFLSVAALAPVALVAAAKAQETNIVIAAGWSDPFREQRHTEEWNKLVWSVSAYMLEVCAKLPTPAALRELGWLYGKRQYWTLIQMQRWREFLDRVRLAHNERIPKGAIRRHWVGRGPLRYWTEEIK